MKIGNLSVLFVMATEQEYGPNLRRTITPLITGVGPVEAAVATGARLGRLAAIGELPNLVFSVGSAGSRTLEHAGVYQISSVSYRDMDASPLGFEKGLTPFLGEPKVTVISQRIVGLQAASISTGGAVITGAGYEDIDADMVDMESYAVLRAASRFHIPMVGVRGISDGRHDLTDLRSWTEYLCVIDEKLAGVIQECRLQSVEQE
jgi:adenosylhomocysteine nucleosidase